VEKSVSTESGEVSEVEVKDISTDVSPSEPSVSITTTVASSESSESFPASHSEPPEETNVKRGRTRKRGKKWVVKEEYIDIIKDPFWESKPWILG
jgi:hypothetical protein